MEKALSFGDNILLESGLLLTSYGIQSGSVIDFAIPNFILGIKPSALMPIQDYSFEGLDAAADALRHHKRGGSSYVRPIGMVRYALNMAKYGTDTSWFDNGDPREWAIAYHGTTVENARAIVENGFDEKCCVRS